MGLKFSWIKVLSHWSVRDGVFPKPGWGAGQPSPLTSHPSVTRTGVANLRVYDEMPKDLTATDITAMVSMPNRHDIELPKCRLVGMDTCQNTEQK